MSVTALLKKLFSVRQAGGTTMKVSVHMLSPTHCCAISRFSTCGIDETYIEFDPPLPLDEALLHAYKYTEKGYFTHRTT